MQYSNECWRGVEILNIILVLHTFMYMHSVEVLAWSSDMYSPPPILGLGQNGKFPFTFMVFETEEIMLQVQCS